MELLNRLKHVNEVSWREKQIEGKVKAPEVEVLLNYDPGQQSRFESEPDMWSVEILIDKKREYVEAPSKQGAIDKAFKVLIKKGIKRGRYISVVDIDNSTIPMKLK